MTVPLRALLKLSGRRSEESSGLLAGGPRRSKAEQLLDVLTDGHRAQNVQEDERTLGVVLTGKITVGQSLDPGDWSERQSGHDATVKDAVEHAEQCREGETRRKHRLHLDQRQIAVVVLQLFLIAFDFLLGRFVQRVAVGFLALFH